MNPKQGFKHLSRLTIKGYLSDHFKSTLLKINLKLEYLELEQAFCTIGEGFQLFKILCTVLLVNRKVGIVEVKSLQSEISEAEFEQMT